MAGAMQSPLAPLSFIGARGFVRMTADADRYKGRNHAVFNLDALGEALRLYLPTEIQACSFGSSENCSSANPNEPSCS